LRSNNILSSDDTASDPRVDATIARRFGVASLVCLPLHHGQDAVGALVVSSRKKAAFSSTDRELLATIAHFVSGLVSTRVSAEPNPLGVTTSLSPTNNSAVPRELVDLAAYALGPELLRRTSAWHRIATVIASKEVATVCQPIVDLVDGSVFAVEALSRFRSQPQRPPDEWFDEASAVGLSGELEIMCLEAALAVLPSLPHQVSLSVNVSPQLLTTGAVNELLQRPERIIIELTEHTAVEDYSLLCEKVAELRNSGARFAVDDTGAGISSFAHILCLKPDFIKLDRSLVSGVATDPTRQALVVALANFACEVGSWLVAEGIESEGELSTLQAFGVQLGQGFYLGSPAPVQALFPIAVPNVSHHQRHPSCR
jgi:EAL domain-containing protein (putative c-di-GMP-specific phosphodiesterase class I)